MSKKIILEFMLLIMLCIPFGFASLSCNESINETNNIIYCNINTNNTEILNPIITSDNAIYFDLDFEKKEMYPNNKYSFKIIVDVYNSKEGKHNLKIVQGKTTYSLDINIIRLKSDVDYSYNLNYNKDNILINLNLQNKTNKNKVLILRNTVLPYTFKTDVKEERIVLEPLESKNIPININYSIPEKLIEYTVFYGSDSYKIKINLDTNNMITKELENKPIGFFTLSNLENQNTILIITDIMLAIFSVLLFTMFVSRLGKYIVRK